MENITLEKGKENGKLKSSDEIDLSELFRVLGKSASRTFSKMMGTLARVRSVSIKHRKLLLSLAVIGGAIGCSWHFLGKKYYDASMIIYCSYLDSKTLTTVFENVNGMCTDSEDSLKQLSSILSIDYETAKALKSIGLAPFLSREQNLLLQSFSEKLEKMTDKDESKSLVDEMRSLSGNANTFLITLKLYDPGASNKLQNGILKFLQDNDYIQKRMLDRRVTLEEKSKKLQRESRTLDSLKHLVNSNFLRLMQLTHEGSNNVILSDKMILDPIAIYQKDLELFNDILSVKSQLFLKNDFEIVSDMQVNLKPANKNIVKNSVVYSAIGLLVGYVLLCLSYFDQYLASLNRRVSTAGNGTQQSH